MGSTQAAGSASTRKPVLDLSLPPDRHSYPALMAPPETGNKKETDNDKFFIEVPLVTGDDWEFGLRRWIWWINLRLRIDFMIDAKADLHVKCVYPGNATLSSKVDVNKLEPIQRAEINKCFTSKGLSRVTCGPEGQNWVYEHKGKLEPTMKGPRFSKDDESLFAEWNAKTPPGPNDFQTPWIEKLLRDCMTNIAGSSSGKGKAKAASGPAESENPASTNP